MNVNPSWMTYLLHLSFPQQFVSSLNKIRQHHLVKYSHICMNSGGSPSHKGYRGETSMIFLVGSHQYSESQSALSTCRAHGWMDGWMDCHVRTHFFLTRLVLGMGSWVLLSCSLLTNYLCWNSGFTWALVIYIFHHLKLFSHTYYYL